MSEYASLKIFEATAAIKLVVWDMDDTFWHGTLSEGGVTLIDRNISIVRELVDRGIMSSISSKNEHEAVKQVLADAGIWDLFVFPQISWNAKGGALETIINHANLRADNILFVDDNPINLEEIRFRFPTMMVAHPDEVLEGLLDLPQAKGKDDRKHSRLEQYKNLEKKVSEQTGTTLSNEDFLRQCEVKLSFDFDVEAHFDRIVELVNRSNQLNYTKVRLETDEAIADFRAKLQRHDIMSAAISARDRYGDHGMIGFYMQHKDERQNRLIHYVWSCRMMNAGLEQYVYERIGSPDITVAEPVSNPIVTFPKIDWIEEVAANDDGGASALAAQQLLLIGSCDLSAVASYCSRDRREYVNAVKNDIMTRCDDFGFILNDPAKVAASSVIETLPAWGRDEFLDFHRELPQRDVVIISLSAALRGAHLVTSDDVVVRVHPNGLGEHIDAHPWEEFLAPCSFYGLDLTQKLALLNESFDHVRRTAKPGAQIFVLGANTRDAAMPLSATDRELMTTYNAVCEAYCAPLADWHYVSIDAVVPKEQLVDDRHYTRIGYFAIATDINRRIAEAAPAIEAAGEAPHAAAASGRPFDLVKAIRAGQRLSRFTVFGPERKDQGMIALSRRVLNRSLKRVVAAVR
ncbi:HAD-IIIC family phosphatase [Sphingomonas sp. AP4-R1]|uniref:HAD-IIIC family phosphatase n=1 Tax=Sphingomonas sp. AP4-R1 TaxID=2735134 RepID=UPI0014939C12|nr:HAD-IIIC family phosphatase [Sphingomonas sp. AP4-R1]QJU56505.1 HAD-IIIC family phosphatase [Sphingomonas sp. AP4-R1]